MARPRGWIPFVVAGGRAFANRLGHDEAFISETNGIVGATL
jgi:hypothetical protein